MNLSTSIAVLGLFASTARPQQATSRWPAPASLPTTLVSDRSPHKQYLIPASDATRLHVLDWGGKGPAVVFVPGHGLNAHVYDDFAPRLTPQFRVVAITLRGWAPSDAPASGYTTNRAAADVKAILDSLGIKQASLVGHSMGGSIITRAAERYPDRVRALVFLDAAIQDAGTDSTDALKPFPRPAPTWTQPAATLNESLRRYREYGSLYFYGVWTPALANEYAAKYFGLGAAEEARRDSLIAKYGSEDSTDRQQVNFSRFPQPALSICSTASPKTVYPWLTRDSTRWAAAKSYVDTVLRPFQVWQCEKFRSEAHNAEVAMLETSHFAFLWKPADTLQLVRSFLVRVSGAAP